MNKRYIFKILDNENYIKGKIKYDGLEFLFEKQSEEVFKCKRSIFILYIGAGYNRIIFLEKSKKGDWFGGFNNRSNWINRNLEFPKSVKGELYLECEIEKTDGNDILDEWYIEDWSTYYDKEKNIVCIGDYNINNNDIAVEFCENIIAVLEEKYLK